jgi:hypothetical protein
MKNLLKCIIAVIICLHSSTAKTQILNDTAAIRILTDGMQHIYNLEFDNATTAYEVLSRLYPDHPVLNLYNGMKIYWENFPMLPNSETRTIFEMEMRKCIEISNNDNCPSPQYEAEYLLSNICARGFLMLFFSDNDLSSEVTPLVKSSYRILMRTFNYTSSCPDFYYFTGIYNYYRDAYPQVYPIYKAVAFMFPPGDLELGLRQLELCGKNSIALKAEAYAILSWIRMNFETNFNEALPWSKHLAVQYPSNPLYKIYYIKNLLLLKKYEDAEMIISNLGIAGENRFCIAAITIFNGIIQEKKYRNDDAAASLFRNGIDKLSAFGAFANEYAGYGYLGLSRISERKGDVHERRINHRKAMDLVDFKGITFND